MTNPDITVGYSNHHMAPVIIDNLHKFGLEFQAKIIAGIITDKSFLERIVDIIDVDAFENEAHRWIVKEVIAYHAEYKSLPTLQVFKVRIDTIPDGMEEYKALVVAQLRLVYMKISDSDLQFVREQFLEFCKNQKLKSAIVESVDFLKTGEYDKIKSLVDTAMKAGMERNLGHNYHVDISTRMSEMCRAVVPTGWEVVDSLMDGGLGPGELGVIVAPAGIGKCVGPNTKIEISYYETGVPIKGNSGKEYVLWIKPFDQFEFDGKILFGWQIDNILFELEQLKSHLADLENKQGTILKRKVSEQISMQALFTKLGVADEENAALSVPFPLEVKTPYGLKKIITTFRTEKQTAVTSYFRNNSTLKTSGHHRLRVNGAWKEVNDILEDDVVDTETGTTSLLRRHVGKEEVLYDISVEDVHCYYSNGIVSHNSWILCHIGSRAMKSGKNIAHFTLELNENYVGLRYDCCFTGIDFQKIRHEQAAVEEKLKHIKGKLFVKYFPLKTVSAQSLKFHIERIQALLGIKIDEMVVDYADILRQLEKEKNSNSYSEMGGIYEELRQVAGELQIPCWTASQTNRGGSNEEIVTANDISDSYRKVMTADFVMSVSRNLQDKANNTARCHVIKNRFGPDGITLYAKMNTSNGDVQIFDSKSKESAEIQNSMEDSENVVKTMLKSKWNTFREKQHGENAGL